MHIFLFYIPTTVPHFPPPARSTPQPIPHPPPEPQLLCTDREDTVTGFTSVMPASESQFMSQPQLISVPGKQKFRFSDSGHLFVTADSFLQLTKSHIFILKIPHKWPLPSETSQVGPLSLATLSEFVSPKLPQQPIKS